ncbi:GntR family transcriptional regulator [Caryophanon latum]|uniref:GntR family transcriptional regulator n=1 Tax=Caryophanon latum TaxID=33977 RepID=A0A1C0YPI2_9BACL|nr:GntR family transcriptional regulator [Caryophanon latum]OCS89075.1 GntR family transcriptional regulator [Caryophanon latum]
MIQLDNKSDLPIYEQITAQLKQAILRNELRPGDALPSIRALATMLHISVMTTKRAYADLERDGFIETIRGKGSYVTSQHPDLLREQFLQQAEALFTQGIQIAASAKLSKQDILGVFELLLEEEFYE